MKLASINSLAVLVAFVVCSPANTSSSKVELSTLAVPLPSFASSFTKTIRPCRDAPEFVVVGYPNGTFQPGTTTVFLPPQASAISTTYIDTVLSLTEFLVATPLPGSCAPISLPADATDTVTASPPSETNGPGSGGWNSTSSPCPVRGCSKGVDRGAQIIINALDEVTIASFELQAAAKQLGGRWKRLDEDTEDVGDMLLAERFNPIRDLILPLKDISATLLFTLPFIQALPPQRPGCDTDTAIVALMDFVEVQTALLDILIARAGLLDTRAAVGRPGADTAEMVEADNGRPVEERFGFVGLLIAGALRALEVVWDTWVYDLILLLPARQRCLKLRWRELDDTLRRAIRAYQGVQVEEARGPSFVERVGFKGLRGRGLPPKEGLGSVP